jgi:hypothetical protein
MSYIDPRTVISPQNLVADVEVIFDIGSKPDSWSVAKLRWNGKAAVGIRWNGDQYSKVGTPQARGNPTWFIVPDELADRVVEQAELLANQATKSLSAGYRDMASDRQREEEAEQWCEGLIGNANQER